MEVHYDYKERIIRTGAIGRTHKEQSKIGTTLSASFGLVHINVYGNTSIYSRTLLVLFAHTGRCAHTHAVCVLYTRIHITPVGCNLYENKEYFF